ncbi:unnamed protein product [Somion occarium]|uniref:Plasma membrane proteolipid 3 n=1 Tax=Somion occarium TaxID=3059160 RepID=A0ABP1DNC7_9APHY
MPSDIPSSDIPLYFLAIFLPPVAVFLKRKFELDFWINILLTFLGWIPGVLHACPLSSHSTPQSQFFRCIDIFTEHSVQYVAKRQPIDSIVS